MAQDSKSPTTTTHVKLEEQPNAKLSSPSINPLKRKTPPVDDSNAEHNLATAVVLDDGDSGSADGDANERDDIRNEPRGTSSPPPFQERPGEYETGRIDCPSCHKQVAFRDEETGEFSLKRWQQHWESCAGQNQADSNRSPPARFTHQASTAPQKLVAQNMNAYRSGPDDLFPSIMAHPPTKRRRAKRTEEERITYLDADPYVAKFEAYRVLCASCDKWIRLRPNSTYCSIPWDAHRKSCLSKKISNKNTYALDERNSLFSKDPDVRKFDAERVLCAVCDRWIPINSEDHLQAVQTWLNHRGDCAKRAAAVVGVAGPGPSSSSSPHPRDFCSNVPPPPSHMQRPGRLPHPHPPSPPHRDMDPYRHRHQNHHPYPQSVVRRDILMSGDRDIRTRNHRPDDSRVKVEFRERENQQPVNADADADGDLDADADGDPESDLDGSNHIRVVDLSRPPPGQIHIAETHDNDAEHSTSIVLSLSHQAGSVAPPLDTSAPSTEGGSQSEPIMYSPAAGIFPPGPAHESRRRNAEQRAATLRADTLIKHVEPNRVFCSLCEKWVQLRQDSSFCAYPWFQHRGKCLARYQRRAQKAAEIEDIKKRRTTSGTSAQSIHAHDPQRYAPPPPYPPRPHHLYHPSTSHHPHYTYPTHAPHLMYHQGGRLVRGPHPHNGGEEDELAYFSGSDQGRSDEDDISFNYRGLSASASPDSEGRSVSVGSRASHNERSGLDYATENADYVHSRTQLQEEAESTEPDADSNVVDNNARPNGETRAESSGDKIENEVGAEGEMNGSGEKANKQGPSVSQTQSQPSTPGNRPSISMRHRPIAPRDTPILVQRPESRAEINVNEGQHRRTQPSHSLVPVPPRVLNHHHHSTNSVSGMYRPLQQQREREYIGEYMDSRNNRLHAHSYGGKISREKSDRAHQGHSQSLSHGPYGNGPLSSRTSGPASGRGVLADLDSHAGRKQFVSHSIAYLFQTTYDCSPCSSDELSISALVAYLNAAMPMDKHEDFDTAEVVRCVGALREKGRVLLEGDVVRKVRKE
ncbi:hypothetical protein C8R41DRAFT_472670 [Lentinula lateritia]|uniref:Uncharacterized protein n=1 Tax=Lentinula lateritia TaxID=40482 RepID=A0ABQ8V9C2_9AGAR|nr:hypothetical protein C8R41DRAFT_472670 [Lentinula lateritia]